MAGSSTHSYVVPYRLLFFFYINICGSLLCSSTPVATETGTAEVIVTVGGEDDKVVLRSVESLDPVTSQWKNLACLPFAVSKHGLVVSGEGVSKTQPDGLRHSEMHR